MNTKPAQWALLFIRWRWFLLSLACVLSIILGFFATRLTFNFSADNIYLSEDPAYQFYVSRFVKEFGQRASLCLISIDGDIKKKETQKALFELHESLVKVPEVKFVRSLVNAGIYKPHEGTMQIVPVFNDKKEENEGLIDLVRQDSMMQNLLISKTGRMPTLLIQLPRHLGDQSATARNVIKFKKVVERIAQKYPKLQFYVAGAPVLEQEAIGILKEDQKFFIPLAALLMAFLLWFSFRSFTGMILPFIATGASAIWTLGWLVLREHSLDIVNNKLIVLLLVIGTSCGIQILARFQDELFKMRQRCKKYGGVINIDEVLANCVEALALPCFLTTATAALGFGAVVVAKIGIVRQFGLDAAVGVMFSYVTTMLFVPALLRILPLPAENLKDFLKQKKSKWSIDEILGSIARFSMRFASWIIAVSMLITIVGLWIAKDIRADQRLASELPASAPSVQALQFIENHLTGIMPFDIVLEGSPSRLLEPGVIRAAAALEEFTAQQSIHPTVRSFSDLLLTFDKSLSAQKIQQPVSQWSDEKIAQLLLLFEMADPALVQEAKQDFISADGRFYRIQGLLKDANTDILALFRDQLLLQIDKMDLPGVRTHLTGAAIISTNALNYMLDTMLSSLGVAILSIFILVLILLRSVRFAFIILLPNLVPIVTTIAAMQLLEISLRIATVMTFSIALGIAVDACIYLVTRFKEEAILQHLKDDSDSNSQKYHEIIERTMRGSGRPVVYITMMLLVGFSVLSLSNFAALKDFAILSTITLAMALIVDLLLWPALVITVKPKLQFVKN
jgi:uncharacterized protein